MKNPNTGHGHVFLRPDGMVARCGGPRMCRECAADAARKETMAKVKVIKNVEKPETKEILAEAIVRISNGFETLQKNGLNEDAIVALVQDQTGLAKRDIKLVLKSLRTLKGYYCR